MRRMAQGLAVLATVLAVAAGGAARADDVNIQVTPGTQPPAQVPAAPPPTSPGGTTVIMPQGTPTVVVPQPTQATLQADDIEASLVKAGTIYANRIEAGNIQGAIHQTTGVKIEGQGAIKAPTVTAAVIFAEKIKADTVLADHIYVREMKRR